jgi:hypothetical protein
MSSAGLSVCLEALTELEPCSEKAITSPSVMLIVYVPTT